MNSYEFTKTYTRYFFLYKPNEENQKREITSKIKNQMFKNVLINNFKDAQR